MERSKKINLGINILRMWMAFEVILLHRMSWKGYDNLFFLFLKRCELFSVPVFVIISFFFCAKIIEGQNFEKIRSRFIRLIVPQVGWAIICWIVYVLTDIIFMHKLSHDLWDLLIAAVSGCRQNTNPSTWFQCVMIILTTIYCLIFRFIKKETAWKFVYASFFLALFIQWNGAYYDFFQKTPYEVCNTIGRIFELMPFACAGMFLWRIKILDLFKEKRFIFICIFLIMFGIGFFIPFPLFKGFFEGLYPLYMALCLFVIFLFLPMENIEGKGRNAIMKISRFTLGIYCAHRLVFGILEICYGLIGIIPGNFLKCIIVYIVCYFMSFVMCMFPCRYIKMMVD